MAQKAFTLSETVQWTPPGTPDNSGMTTLTSTGTENAQSVGKHDVLASIAPNTVLSIPFGQVDAAKVAIIQNNMSAEIGVRLNGAVANDFTLGPGQKFEISGSTPGSTTPLTQLDVEILTAPTATEYILWWILGD